MFCGVDVACHECIVHYRRREHCQLNVQAFRCHLANIVPKDSKCSYHLCVLALIIVISSLTARLGGGSGGAADTGGRHGSGGAHLF